MSTRAKRAVCECVALRTSRTRSPDWVGQVLGSCERLVHARLSDPAARDRQARLIAAQLAAPFFLSAVAGPAVFASFGANTALAVAAAIFAVSLSNVVLAATGRHFRVAAFLGLTHAFVAAAMAIWLGAPSPLLMLLALAMVGETAFVSRSWRGVAASAIVALPIFIAALVQEGQPGAIAAITGAAASLAYLSLAAMRLKEFIADHDAQAPEEMKLEERLDAVILRMTREGDVMSVSDQAWRMLGIEPDLLTGAAFMERVRVTDRVKILCALSSSSQEPQHVHVTLRVPGEQAGQVDYRDVSLELLRIGADWTAILRDGRETAELRQALDEAAEQAQAVEIAKSRFLAAVSHELRTPLNAIIGFSDMLLHHAVSGPLSPKQTEYVGLIGEAGNHLLAVVNSILDLSKIEAGAYSIRPEPFALKDAIDLTASLLEGQAADKGLTLQVIASEDIGEVNADQRAVHQILLNLLSNAIKFTPQGGHISISSARYANAVSIAVTDTGIGIKSEDLAGLGKPFAQVQNDYTRKFEGTGLGLSLVKGLVALHDGDLSIESAPGEGTTVTVNFPVGRSAPVTALDTISNTDGPDTHGTFRKIA